MMDKLIIRNFGSNRRIDIDLDPHVTCLTGESYTGKSWVVRALKWLSLNRPSGTQFIYWGSKKAIVRAHFGKHTVKRVRSKAENTYYLDGRKLEAFGNNVPAHVRRVVNLSELNFQLQQEMPHGDGPLFWFALSPGQVSKRLNAIVNLDVIDRTLGNLQSGVHKAKATLDVCRQRKQEARERVESLAFVKEMASDWEGVKTAIVSAQSADDQQDRLGHLLNEAVKGRLTLDAMNFHVGEADKELQELESLRDTIIELDGRSSGLKDLLKEVERLQQERDSALEDVKEAEKAYKKALGNRCPFTGDRCPKINKMK